MSMWSTNMQVNKVANFINNSKFTQKVLRGVSNNPTVFSAVTSFALASGLRPLLMDVMSFKDKKDLRTSQASAISTGLCELAMTAAIFVPLNKSIGKASSRLYDMSGTLYHENKEVLRQFKSVTNRGIKLLLLPAISYVRFALIKPLTNYMMKGMKNDK